MCNKIFFRFHLFGKNNWTMSITRNYASRGKRFWNTRGSLKVVRLVWNLSYSPRRSRFFFPFFFGNFSALRIKMRNEKPDAAGHALPRPSAKLQVSICERKRKDAVGAVGVASTSCTPRGYLLYLMQRSRGVFRQSFAYNRLATDLWIFIYCEKRCGNFSLRSFESRAWKRETYMYVPSTRVLILEDIFRSCRERVELVVNLFTGKATEITFFW